MERNRSHVTLIVCWLLAFAVFAAALIFQSEVFVSPPFFAAMVLSVISYRAVRNETGPLVRPWLYRILLGTLLVASFGTAIAAGATMMFDVSLRHLGGFVVLGSVNLVLAIATWRALLEPNAASAARAGMFGVIVQMFALLIDLVINAALDALDTPVHGAMFITVLACMITMGAGSLACIAALGAFGDDAEAALPEARVVDES